MTVLFDVPHSTSWKGITYHPGLQNIPDDLARALGYQEKIVPTAEVAPVVETFTTEEVAPTVAPATAEAVSAVETPTTLQNTEVLPAVETSTTEEVAPVVETPPTPPTEVRRRRSS
ncbi:MAG TPA: hypothetical protein VK184_08400 [Nostocaceae cyanobacterium]|nr:hypothetical protein [Nostocaceae cyanobacterium]